MEPISQPASQACDYERNILPKLSSNAVQGSTGRGRDQMPKMRDSGQDFSLFAEPTIDY